MGIENLIQDSENHIPNSNLEGKTKSLFLKTLKKFSLWDWIKIGATTTASIALGSTINAVSYLASYVSIHYISSKKKNSLTPNGLKSEFHLANAMSIFMTYIYRGLSKLNPIERTVTGIFGTIPLFNLVYLSARHVIHNYSPWKFVKRIIGKKKKGLLNEIYSQALKPNYFKTTKDTYKYMSLPLAMTWNYVPLEYQLAATSVARFGYKYVLEKATSKENGKFGYSIATA